MDCITGLKLRVLSGEQLGKDDALELCGAPLEPLCTAAVTGTP